MAQSHGDAVYGIVPAVIRQAGNFASAAALQAEIQIRQADNFASAAALQAEIQSRKNSGSWQRVSDDTTLVAGSKYAPNTLVKPIKLILPENPVEGSSVSICDDGKSFSTNNVTIDGNGNTIEGLSENMVVSETGALFTMCYLGNTWRVY